MIHWYMGYWFPRPFYHFQVTVVGDAHSQENSHVAVDYRPNV